MTSLLLLGILCGFCFLAVLSLPATRELSDIVVDNDEKWANLLDKSKIFKISEMCSNFITYPDLHRAIWDAARAELGLPPLFGTNRTNANDSASSAHRKLAGVGRARRKIPRNIRKFKGNETKTSRYPISKPMLSKQQREVSVMTSSLRTYFGLALGCTSVPIFGTEVTYVTLWKCANDAIRLNLLSQAEAEYSGAFFARKDYVYNYFSKYSRMIGAKYNTDKLPPAFTFVREPISHFVSGVTEYYWRAQHNDIITTEMLRNDIIGFFEMTKLHDRPRSLTERKPAAKVKSYELKHFAAMSGILKQRFNIQYIGKLEQFEADWKSMNSMYGFNLAFNNSLGIHPTSKDPNKVKASFDELLTKEVRFKRALCHLLIVDYECFGYSLPKECDGISPALYSTVPRTTPIVGVWQKKVTRRSQPARSNRVTK